MQLDSSLWTEVKHIFSYEHTNYATQRGCTVSVNSLESQTQQYRNPDRIPNKQRIKTSRYVQLTWLHTEEIARDLSCISNAWSVTETVVT
jgi:hypothetical protein